MLENVPFQAHQGVPHGFCNWATRRALTSLEEKIKVCERPDRLGSATNPEMSELWLAGLESSTTDKLWNKWKQGTHLLKKHRGKQYDFCFFIESKQTNDVRVRRRHVSMETVVCYSLGVVDFDPKQVIWSGKKESTVRLIHPQNHNHPLNYN